MTVYLFHQKINHLLSSIKKSISHKPDSVTGKKFPEVIIYLVAPLLTQSSCLPFNVSINGFGRAALRRWYMWHYSTQGLPVTIITNRYRELLPHIFIFTGFEKSNLGQLFSVALSLS
jgi:hypothetical protein